MMSRWQTWVLGLVGMGLFMVATSFAQAADSPKPDKKGVAFFEKKIRPVLVESCYECHSTRDGNKVKGGLVLDSREGVLRGGESGPSIEFTKQNQLWIVSTAFASVPRQRRLNGYLPVRLRIL